MMMDNKENDESFSPFQKKQKKNTLETSPLTTTTTSRPNSCNSTPTKTLDFSEGSAITSSCNDDDTDVPSSCLFDDEEFNRPSSSSAGGINSSFHSASSLLGTPHSSVFTPPELRHSVRLSLSPNKPGSLVFDGTEASSSSSSSNLMKQGLCGRLDFGVCSSRSSITGTVDWDMPTPSDVVLSITTTTMSAAKREEHTLLSPHFANFGLSPSPAAKKKKPSLKNRPTNIVVPSSTSPFGKKGEQAASASTEREEEVETPLISPQLANSNDDIFGFAAMNNDLERKIEGFSEPSKRLAREIGVDDEIPSPTTPRLVLETVEHPKNALACNIIDHITLIKALNNPALRDKITIVDCRFPHEYNGGHIINAINLYKPEDMLKHFLNANDPCLKDGSSENRIIVFHCEYSQCRAPKMCSLLRRFDRDLNPYPNLFYPNTYVLEGGYKEFWQVGGRNLEYCEPQTYVRMDDDNFKQECKVSFSALKKDWKTFQAQTGRFF